MWLGIFASFIFYMCVKLYIFFYHIYFIMLIYCVKYTCLAKAKSKEGIHGHVYSPYAAVKSREHRKYSILISI